VSDRPGRPGDPRPHIAVIVIRGEAVRNFLYSGVLRRLHQDARVTLLTAIEDPSFYEPVRDAIDDLIVIHEVGERSFILRLRKFVRDIHFRWLWSRVAQNSWEFAAQRATGIPARVAWLLKKAVFRLFAFRPIVAFFGRMEEYLTWTFRPTRDYDRLFHEINPDLVFNTSHIHGQAGELPAKIAHRLGYPVAGFVFSWDNLTSRSRIFVPYDHYLVWHEPMRRQLCGIYPDIPPACVHVTGTPQFDFHFDPAFVLPREELCRRLGIDALRPFILWTTGISFHFPEEHRHIAAVIDMLHDLNLAPKPQLVVRMYVKGLSAEMLAMSKQHWPDVVFPEVGWDERWATPRYDDLEMYTSLLHHASMSINAASTVTLEFLMLDKPVMNIGFDPPGSALSHADRWSRHIEFDHFRPIAESGAVMVARSLEDMNTMIRRGLENPQEQSGARKNFMRQVFGDTLDGNSGRRVAETLLAIAVREPGIHH
jgi:hypothetical protein